MVGSYSKTVGVIYRLYGYKAAMMMLKDHFLEVKIRFHSYARLLPIVWYRL